MSMVSGVAIAAERWGLPLRKRPLAFSMLAILVLALLAGVLPLPLPVALAYPKRFSHTTLLRDQPALMTYALSHAHSMPNNVVRGPDGAFWFTEWYGNRIGRISPTGSITHEYIIPTPFAQPEGITPGPDGRLWFTEFGTGRIGSIMSSGQIKEYQLPDANSGPRSIVAGPDGALYFTLFNSGQLGRITSDGQISTYTLPIQERPAGITLGTDGALYYTDFTQNCIGRLTLPFASARLTRIPIPTSHAHPLGITRGRQGFIWFTEAAGNKIGRLHPSASGPGTIVEYALPSHGGRPHDIVSADDGTFAFTEPFTARIGYIDQHNTITELSVARNGRSTRPWGIASGGPGQFWFAEETNNAIGTLHFSSASHTSNSG